MPAAITHYFQAQRVMEELEKHNNSIEINKDAFLWGAQGPDFLYCHRYLPWQHGESLKEYATKLHNENPSKTLAAMRDFYAERCHDNLVLSYIDGFICHYCLDRVAHPFINYGTQVMLQQQPQQNEEIIHNEIESALDVIILRYEKAALSVDFNLKRTVPKNADVQSETADLYVDILNQLYGIEVGHAALLQSMGDCRFLFGLLNDRTTIKKSLVEHFEKRNGKRSISCHLRGISEGDEYDYANILQADWNWPMENQAIHDESFLILYENSIVQSMEMIDGFLRIEDISKLTNDILFV